MNAPCLRLASALLAPRLRLVASAQLVRSPIMKVSFIRVSTTSKDKQSTRTVGIKTEHSGEYRDIEMSLSAPPPKKRDRIRGLFRRSPSPLPVRTAAASPVTPSQGPVYTTSGSSVLADALEALESDDRETIRTLLLPTNAVSVDTALDEVFGCAKELQQRCTNKRWSWNYKGRKVYLLDQMEKMVQLLDKFKAVGDVVANVDPVHVGLPWAGIRVILEVSIRPKTLPF
jgi:hypothetical protein